MALAQIRTDIRQLAERDSGETGNAGAQTEGRRIDPAAPDPHRPGHVPILRDGSNLQPQGRETQNHGQRGEHADTEEDDVEPVVGEGEGVVDHELSAHPFRRRNGPVERREDRTNRLLENEAHAKGRQQGLQGAPVQKPNDTALDPHSDERRHEEGDGDRRKERCFELTGHQLLDHPGRIGSEHHQLAVGHVDHTHHAEGDCETRGGEHQDESETQAEEHGLDERENAPRAIDLFDRKGRGVTNRLVRLAGCPLVVHFDELGEPVSHFPVQAPRQDFDGLESDLGIRVVEF